MSLGGPAQAMGEFDPGHIKIEVKHKIGPWTRNKHLEVVLDTIAIFGVERCMFGSNYPVERLYAPYEAIMRDFMEMTRSFSVEERRALFHDYACHYYRIVR